MYLLWLKYHSASYEELINLTQECFKDLAGNIRKGGRIIVNDLIRGTRPGPPVFAVNMLVNVDSGGTWTYEQYKIWLEDAGFLFNAP